MDLDDTPEYHVTPELLAATGNLDAQTLHRLGWRACPICEAQCSPALAAEVRHRMTRLLHFLDTPGGIKVVRQEIEAIREALAPPLPEVKSA